MNFVIFSTFISQILVIVMATDPQNDTTTVKPRKFSPHVLAARHEIRNCGKSRLRGLSKRIIGGHESLKDAWPWQVVLLNGHGEAYCGATVITSQFLLTAAHCIRKRMSIKAGEYDLRINESSEQRSQIHRVFIHPRYNKHTVDNDVALIQLKQPLKLNRHVWPVCLAPAKSKPTLGQAAVIVGWGKKKNWAFTGTDILHEAMVPIASMTKCRKVYEDYFISDNMLCAGFMSGRVDSCAGDSGGPLLIKKNSKWFIHGITSFGDGCGQQGKFGIYAKVANFTKWIKSTIFRHTRPV